jgi:hypothetical protein
LYSSVAPVTVGVGFTEPPKASPAVCVPAPAKPFLAVFKLPGLVVQVDPSYSSVAFDCPGTEGANPPKPNPAV